jgi:hypothetical protein
MHIEELKKKFYDDLNIRIYDFEVPLLEHGGMKCRTNWV